MKINVEKLISQVSKHPEIYNPDHKDFANKEIRDNIFNDSISREMDGIKGEVLHHKWDQVLNKYASFIRKLSNDDSSEKVLERFMEWPWTKNMRIFKPYVRKQFKIPEFQSAVQISDMDPEDLPDIPLLSMPMQRPAFPTAPPPPRQEFPHPLSMLRPEFSYGGPRPAVFARSVLSSAPRQEFSHPLSVSRPEFVRPMSAGPRPEVAHSVSNREFVHGIPMRADFGHGLAVPEYAHSTPIIQRIEMPAFMENIFVTSADRNVGHGIRNIATMLGLDRHSEQDADSDDNNVTDGEIDVDEDVDTGERTFAAKRSRLEEQADDGGAHKNSDVPNDCREYGADTGPVLPDLPQQKPLAERGHTDFTAQEHTFLAWAKTMSTFTAKRQATIKMQINKIMTEAEFEDLDDEFFAANTTPRRSIYTSRL